MRESETRKFYDDVARLIAEARRTHIPPLTQEDLAGRTDSLNRSGVANIESLRQRVALHQLLEIAEVLSLSPSDLIPKKEPGLARDRITTRDIAATAFLATLREAKSGRLNQEEP